MNSSIIKKKFFVAIALLCGGVFVGGCATYGIDTQSYESLKAQFGTMHRGIVFKVAPDDAYQKLLAAFEGDSEKFRKAHGLSLEAARDKQFVFIDRWRIPGGGSRQGVFAEKHFALEVGDIVDYMTGIVNDEHLRTKSEPINSYGLGWALGVWYIGEGNTGEALQPHKMLGVVCRADEPGCTYNSSPETTIGIGRKLSSPADYRGVEAESQQPMRPHNLTIAEFFSASYCVECTDEEREQWVE